MIRCSMEFDTCENLLKGLEIFIKTVESKQTCLHEIVRIKNMFLQNERDGLNLYNYADLKLNVIMTDKMTKLSMIVEVQFMLSFMKHAKSLGHGLYEIERDLEFVQDLQEVMQVELFVFLIYILFWCAVVYSLQFNVIYPYCIQIDWVRQRNCFVFIGYEWK